MEDVVNAKVKHREGFRPFAPAVASEAAERYFEGCGPDTRSPFMLLAFPVVKAKRSVIPAVTHVDDTARVQTVDPERHGLYHRLLEAFEARTGCPVVINTSFNVRGEPIVCTPEDAWQCFMGTNMDALVVGPFVLLKENQPLATAHAVDEYLARFQPD